MAQNHHSLSRRGFVSAALSLPLALAACGAQETQQTAAEPEDVTVEEPEGGSSEASIVNGILVAPLDNGFSSGIHHATIEVRDFGTIKVELNASNAPITVSNFAELVNAGFYDGLTFHRVIEGFMIQGGDPLGNGTGGSSVSIKGEFSANGIANVIQHKRGVISMARSSALDSASSQFFIMHQDASHLDGQYAAFGHVTEGMEVVDAIAESTPVEDDNGTVAPENQPRITSVVMDD